MRRTLAPIIVAALITAAGCTSGHSVESSATPSSKDSAHPTAPPPENQQPDTRDLQQAYSAAMHRILPSLVQISAGPDAEHELGSGILFDNAGNVVTNAHVVAKRTTFSVRLSNGGNAWRARLVGVYAPDDLAVIHLQPAPHGRPATFANSAKVRPGDIVLAAGNPVAAPTGLTVGIVAATGRTLTEHRSATTPATILPDSIQTSAAITASNNGGALVDMNGQVIGLSTPASPGGGAPATGFAIPANLVTDIADQIIHYGHVVHSDRATLDAGLSDAVDPVSGEAIGVSVDQVRPNGPAAHAGIAPGDLITSINNTGTPTAELLAQALARLRAGSTVQVHIAHPNGSTSVVRVTLAELRSGG